MPTRFGYYRVCVIAYLMNSRVVSGVSKRQRSRKLSRVEKVKVGMYRRRYDIRQIWCGLSSMLWMDVCLCVEALKGWEKGLRWRWWMSLWTRVI